MAAVRLIVFGIVLAISACSTNVRAPAFDVPVRSDLSGAWILTVESSMGKDDVRAIFRQSGEQLTGTMVSSSSEMPLQGRVQGNQVSFDMILSVRGEELKLHYSGVVEGDRMGGSVQFGPIGSGQFSGVRKAVTPAP